MVTPPVVAKRTSRYRGPVAPEDGTGVGSGNPTGVNSFSACHGGRNARITVKYLNLVHQGVVIPLGFTPWNPFSACLLGRSDSIGEDSRNLLKPDGTIPRGLRKSKKRFSQKLH